MRRRERMINEVAEAIRTLAPAGEKLDEASAQKFARYLSDFGYLLGMLQLAELPERIKAAQANLLVEPDGWAGEETYKAARKRPRCGNPDVHRIGVPGHLDQWLKDKATSGQGITYHFRRYVNGLSPERQEQSAVEWLTKIEKVSGIRFHRLRSDQADIIYDASASRQEEFGTVGNVLAWAYKPNGPGHRTQLLCKFDLAENWSVELHRDTGLHETGHLCGLDHCQIPREMMFPSIQEGIHDLGPRFDIPQLQQRYGQPASVPVPTPAPAPAGVNIGGTINGQQYRLTRV